MSNYKLGVDISEHNGVNFNVQPYDFVMIRAAWGTNTDSLFKTYVDKCERYNIPYGVYLYSYALNDEGAEDEANYILDLVKGLNIKCGVWFDYEDADGYKAEHGVLNRANSTRWCKIFCDKVSKKGYYTGVYCNPDYLTNYVDTTYPLWLASWNGKPEDISGAGKYQKQVVLHQYEGDPLDKDALLVSFDELNGGAAKKEDTAKKETKTDKKKIDYSSKAIPENCISESGIATVIVDAIKIREEPSLKGKDTGIKYHRTECVRYDCKIYAEGYVWISWIGSSGKRRYMAGGKVDKNNKRTESYCTFK